MGILPRVFCPQASPSSTPDYERTHKASLLLPFIIKLEEMKNMFFPLCMSMKMCIATGQQLGVALES